MSLINHDCALELPYIILSTHATPGTTQSKSSAIAAKFPHATDISPLITDVNAILIEFLLLLMY